MLPTGDTAVCTFHFESAPGAQRQSDRALDHLRTLIVTLELEPGSVIDEDALCQRLACGRTPLREAMYRLAEERLVVILPHRSVAVAPLTISDLQHIYEARVALESAALRLAAQRISPTQLAELKQRERELASLSENTQLTIFMRWAARHVDFHYVMAKACDNQYLVDSIRRILPVSMRLNFFLFRHGAMPTDRARNHEAIVQALDVHDADAAEIAIRRHITGAKERILSLL